MNIPFMRLRRCSVASLLLALVMGPATAAGQTVFSGAQDPIAGKRVFTDKRCVSCHAVNGKGGTVGPDLARVARPRTFYDLAAALWNHAPQMAARMRRLGIPRPELTARESGDLAAYLFTLSYFDAPGDAEAGRRLFTTKSCATCHAIAGAGGSVGPRLDAFTSYGSPIALAAAMWNHGREMTAAMERAGVQRPRFSGSELLDLMAFIDRVSGAATSHALYVLPGRAEEGRRVYIDKHCVNCHAPSTGRDGAIDLGERQANKSVADFAAAMWNKLPRMAEEMKARSITFIQLRPEQMADVVAYLYSVRYFAEAGDPKNGVALATYKGCFGCHGLYGDRGKPASDLTTSLRLGTPAGVMAALWNHSFISDPRTGREAGTWPTLTGREMADLIAYLKSLPHSP